VLTSLGQGACESAGFGCAAQNQDIAHG
jgi:hypothetical protein